MAISTPTNAATRSIRAAGTAAPTAERPVMRLKAELRCYECGHLAAEVEGIYGKPIKLTSITPVGEPRWEVRRGERPVCPRCSGRLHLDEIETYRERPVVPMRPPTPLRRAS